MKSNLDFTINTQQQLIQTLTTHTHKMSERCTTSAVLKVMLHTQPY